jgi:hypothetical protein
VERKNYVIGDVNGDGYIDVALATTTETAGISELYILSVNWLDAEQDLALKELIPYVQYADGLGAEHNDDGTFIISNDSPAGSLVKDNGEVIVGPSRYQWDVSERKYILNQNRNPQSTPAAAKKKK